MQTVERNKERDKSIDIAKGIGIILVVWGHLPCCLFQEIYLFHMPLFFFLSGLFFYPQNGCNVFFAKKIKGLIYPFAFFNLLFFIYGYIFSEYENLHDYISSAKDISSFDGPTWFLLTLFEISIFCFVLEKYMRLLAIRIVTIVVVTLLGYWLCMNNLEFFPFISRACVGMIFFYIGYVGRKYKLFKGRWHFAVILLCVAGYSMGIIFDVNTNMAYLMIDCNYLLFFIPAVCGSLLTLFISKYLVNKTSLNWLSYVGQNSLLIMCVHFPLISNLRLLVGFILKYFYLTLGGVKTTSELATSGQIGGLVMLIILVPLSLYLGLLLKRLFPWVFNK